MQLNENSIPEAAPVNVMNEVVIEPASGIDLPTPSPVKQPRNQHLKVEEPKSEQFTARCTKSEHAIIKSAMAANGCTDIVRLMLFSIDLHKKDLFTSFKTK